MPLPIFTPPSALAALSFTPAPSLDSRCFTNSCYLAPEYPTSPYTPPPSENLFRTATHIPYYFQVCWSPKVLTVLKGLASSRVPPYLSPFSQYEPLETSPSVSGADSPGRGRSPLPRSLETLGEGRRVGGEDPNHAPHRHRHHNRRHCQQQQQFVEVWNETYSERGGLGRTEAVIGSIGFNADGSGFGGGGGDAAAPEGVGTVARGEGGGQDRNDII